MSISVPYFSLHWLLQQSFTYLSTMFSSIYSYYHGIKQLLSNGPLSELSLTLSKSPEQFPPPHHIHNRIFHHFYTISICTCLNNNHSSSTLYHKIKDSHCYLNFKLKKINHIYIIFIHKTNLFTKCGLHKTHRGTIQLFSQ